MRKSSKPGPFQPTLLSLAVCLAINAGASHAQMPTGMQVISGSASASNPAANALTITNTPNAIINWQSFSIGAGNVVNFAQQSAASAVLNRVTGGQMSQLMGTLRSNGQVFLVNPAGILVGSNAMIDTAGFVASTLQILDADFLAGRLKFQGDENSGRIVNQGWIRTGYGGNVVLVAPNIENGGLIQAPGGKILLAAGQKMTLTSLDLGGVSFEVQAPTDSVLNLGQLIAEGGVVRAFAGSLRHSGDIRANALTRDAGGEIVLKAKGDVELMAGSSTVANGRTGGTIVIESETGTARVAGTVSATGSSGAGGRIDVLGDRVSLVGNAELDASGASAGGSIRVGGDWQGANPDVRNARNTFVGENVSLKADATDAGAGGNVVVWGDIDTRYHGSISARGGPNGGDGGQAEVSGKGNLLFTGRADLTAPRGRTGSLLLDPLDLFVDNAGGLNQFIIDEAADFPANAATVSPATLAGIGANVTLYASRDMRINSAITLGGFGLSARADRDLQIGAGITTGGGALSLSAGSTLNVFGGTALSTANGAVSLGAQNFVNGSSISVAAGTGNINASASAGTLQLGTISSAGAVNLSASGGSLGLSNITSTGPVTLSSSLNISGNNITTGGGALSANAAGSSVSLSNIDTRLGGGPTGGAVTLTSGPSSISTGNIQAGDAAVNASGTSVSTNNNTITTTGNVGLTATAGTISATVNDAANVTANASRTISSTSINLSSTSVTTPLNATSINATATVCNFSNSCPGANVSLSGTMGVNVGTVTASAPATFSNAAPFNSISESVSISSSGGSIRAMAGGGQVTATDVTLSTSQGSGGGIGIAGAPITVNNARNLTFNPNGEFNAVLTGSGPNRLSLNVGVAPTGQTYAGTLTKAGQINLNVSANDTTVTANTFAITGGFNDLVFNQGPFATLRVPNGALTATNVSMPAGDVTGRPSQFFPFALTFQPLAVTLRASGNLLVSNYTRAAGSQAKSTTFQSDSGSVTLGTVSGNLDSMTVSASTDATITSLSTAGFVSVNASSGNIAVNNVTSSGSSVSMNANNGVIGAINDGPGVEITASASVNLSANRIGTAGFTNPLDIAGNSVSLTTTGAGTYIGSGTPPNNAVTAATTTLNINAAGQYNVNSPVDLTNLTVTASPSGVGAGGIARVTSSGTQYDAASDGTNFTLANWTAPATQFAGGTLSFTSIGNSNVGNITLNNIDFSASGGGLFVQTNHLGAGAVTQTGGSTLDLGSGALDIRANGAVSLDTASFGSLSASVGNSSFGSAGRQTIGGSTVFGVASFNANTINPNSGFFNVTSRGAITTNDLPVGSVSLTAYSGGVSTGALGSGASPLSSATISTASTFSGGGNISTGVIEADNLTLSARANTITIGGAGTINAVNTGASSVNITNNFGAGTINATGGINAGSVTLTNDGTTNTGNINAAAPAPSSITLRSNGGTFNTGSLDADSISWGGNSNCCFTQPNIINVGGAIGGNTPGTNVSFSANTVTINGAVTLDAAASGNISVNSGNTLTINGAVTGGATGNISLSSGNTLAVNGAITGGDGSSITLSHGNSAAPFQFTRIDAGATGRVDVNAAGGIQQTATAAANGGIRASTVILRASDPASAIAGPAADGNRLTLRETTDLTIDTGNASSITLTGASGAPELFNLFITRGQTGATFLLDNGTPNQLNATQALTVADVGADTRLTLSNTGATPLLFTYTNNAAASNIEVFGSGISTKGGTVNLNANGGNLIAGTIDTRDATFGDGGVNLFASGILNVNGVVNAGANSISASASGSVTGSALGQLVSTSNVNVTSFSGDIGAAATPLRIDAPVVSLRDNSFTRDVFGALTNTSNLTVSAGNGFNISTDTALSDLNVTTLGTGVNPLALTGPGQSFGFVRDIPGTAVNLTGVTSGAPLNSLGFNVSSGSVRVLGAQAADTLNISATNTLTLDGTAPLTLNNANSQSFSAGTIVASGTVTAASGSQSFSSGGATNLTGTVNLNATSSQSFFAGGNLTFTGTGGLTSTGSQSTSINGNQTYTAAGGPIAITAADQSLRGNGAGSKIEFQGGTAAGESITVSASSSQTLQTPDTTTAGNAINLFGGSGANSSVTVSYGGTGTQFVQGGTVALAGGSATDAFAAITTATGAQRIRATTNVTLTGGTATGASASITNTSAQEQRVGESQLICSFCGAEPYQTDNVTLIGGTGAAAQIIAGSTQKIQADLGVSLTGGSGAAGAVKIENTNAATEQRIGCNSSFELCATFTNTIGVVAGTTGANAQIIAAGNQRLRTTGALTLTASVDPATSAKVLMNGAGSTQQFQIGGATLTAGAGAGSVAELVSAGSQTGSLGTTSILGGAGAGSQARIQAASTQNLSFGNLTLTAGANSGSQALLAADSGQSISANTVQLTGGTGSAAAGGEASALMRNNSGTQQLSAGNVTITSGADFASAGISNLGSSQSISAGAVTITTSAGANGLTGAGALGSGYYSGILQGSGTQTFSVSSINVNNANAPGPVGISAPTQNITAFGGVTVQTSAGDARISGTTQTIGASGVVTVQVNAGSGTASIDATSGTQTIRGTSASTALAGQAASSGSANGGVRVQVSGGAGGTARIANTGGSQTIIGSFVDIKTAANGTAVVSASGNQSIHTTNGGASGGFGSLHVAAVGGGSATLSSGGDQLLQIDYPEQMQSARDGRITVGTAGATGISTISAVNQDVFARSITINGGAAGGANSKIDVTGTQNISLVSSANGGPAAGITLQGGAGGTALIDPVQQTILSNGLISVTGGSGPGTTAGILATGDQTILVTAPAAANSIELIGGTGANAFATIGTSGLVQRIGTSGGITLTAGSGSNADAAFTVRDPGGQIFFACGTSFTCTIVDLPSNPFANTIAEAGAFRNPFQVPLPLIIAASGGLPPDDSGFLAPFDPSILVLTNLRDSTLEDERLDVLFGRRLPQCR